MKKKRTKATETIVGVAGVSTAGLGVAGLAVAVSDKTHAYNTECNQYRRVLAAEVKENQSVLNEKLKTNPDYVGDRAKAVSTAYKYEAADIKMGGKGSANWNSSERKELLSTGKVRGCEGHHINSVAENPSQQTNPDNICFYRSKKEHLEKGHDGDYRNPSSGELIDKDKMLKDTNTERVIVNETLGVLLVSAIGAIGGVGFSVYETCKEDGVSLSAIKKGFKKSGKNVLYSTLCALSVYGTVRGLDEIIN